MMYQGVNVGGLEVYDSFGIFDIAMARVFECCFIFHTWSTRKMSNRGGKRENAGRPRGQGKYGEPTITMRIPESQGDLVNLNPAPTGE